jgi:hypothetical protein
MKNQIIKFAQTRIEPYQFYVEYSDGEKRPSTEDEIMSLWFVWVNQTDSCKEHVGEYTVFAFGKNFLKENNLYTMVKRSDEDRKKYLKESNN